MEDRPRSGEFYRHFKGNCYQVSGIAEHSETGEELVIYQALYGDFRLYARPLASFVEELDPTQYPDSPQRYRFQKISFDREGFGIKEERNGQKTGEEETAALSPLLEFLEAESWKEKLEVLEERQEELTEELLEVCAESVDVVLEADQDFNGMLYEFISVLKAKERYEKGRR